MAQSLLSNGFIDNTNLSGEITSPDRTLERNKIFGRLRNP